MKPIRENYKNKFKDHLVNNKLYNQNKSKKQVHSMNNCHLLLHNNNIRDKRLFHWNTNKTMKSYLVKSIFVDFSTNSHKLWQPLKLYQMS